MKILKTCLFSIFFCLFTLVSISVSAQNYPDSLQLTGSIFNDRSHVKKAVVYVYNQNKRIKRIEVKSSNRFKTYLPTNAFLTIEITAPEFHTKRFAFDSHIPNDLEKIPPYDFDMDIFSEEELSGVNTSLLDFPIGLVNYHPKKKEFLRNKDYTKRMKKKYLQLLEESYYLGAEANE